MIYTEQTKKAMQIAYDAHHGQVDKGGMPYIYHPIHLAEQLEDETEICAALLHDVVEDTQWTLEALRAEGISVETLAVLSVLTHEEGEDYMTYLKRILENPVAKKIKRLDMAHNMDLSRLPENAAEAATHFTQKYREPWALLNQP